MENKKPKKEAVAFRMFFEENLMPLRKKHLLRFVNCVGEYGEICINKAWYESSKIGTTNITVKVKFFVSQVGYIYQDHTTFDGGCSSVSIDKIPDYNDLNECPKDKQENPDCETCCVSGCARGEYLIAKREELKKKALEA